MKSKGFTLIELLVVIAIIGILATVVIASLGVARQRAQIARTQSELVQLRTVIAGAQLASSQTVLEMTNASGNGTYSSCPAGTDLSSLAATHACKVDWETAISTIANIFGSPSSEGFYQDVWGSPYLLDEQEGQDLGNPCLKDTLNSAGPDRTAYTIDDFGVDIPYESCSG